MICLPGSGPISHRFVALKYFDEDQSLRPRDNQSTETVRVTPVTRSISVSQAGGGD